MIQTLPFESLVPSATGVPAALPWHAAPRNLLCESLQPPQNTVTLQQNIPCACAARGWLASSQGGRAGWS